MTKFRKILIPLLLFILLLSETAFASESADTNRKLSLTVNAVYDKTGIEGMEFQLYLISTMNEDGTLSVTEEFKDAEKELQITGKNDGLWKNAAQKIQQKILKESKRKPVATAKSNQNGTAVFENLKKGLYFVFPGSVTVKEHVYSSSAFFVLLPEKEQASVCVNAKIEKKELLEDYSVLKIWKDQNQEDQRPKFIEITLLCDGKEYDTIKLPQNGRWQYTWSDLETAHQWTVTEGKVKGYETSSIVQEGNTFTVTNTCTQKKQQSETKLPQTGQLWWPVPMLLCAGFLSMIIGLLCGKGKDNES